MKSYKLFVEGKIQGVGFRPLVYRLAISLGLCGYVRNNAIGAEIVLQGERREEFLQLLPLEIPKIAQIQSLQIQEFEDLPYDDFKILDSKQANHFILPPLQDLALCKDCKADMANQNNPRYLYPLINCTNCGPRQSVIRALPYDRERTSMADFVMCEACKQQYQDPNSRFFHAQPISCAHCGPKLFYRGVEIKGSDFKQIAHEIECGEIVLIKGIGGFHLVCSALHKESIQKLRILKNRPSKPLALMCKDIEQVQEIAELSLREEELLSSACAPIVLLKAKRHLEGIAPNLQTYGIMLAYTPIYELLFSFLKAPLVVTSANPKGEPIVYEDTQLHKLSSITSVILTHQREILHPAEDSIVQVLSTQDTIVLRNARGYAPMSFKLEKKLPYPLLAVGGHQKAAFAFGFEDLVICSPYIGDLDTLEGIERYKQRLSALCALYGISSFEEVICDLHPFYESSKMARYLGKEVIQIQHHYAHTLSVCFEYQIQEEVLSFCFDGTGYGEDGKIWGGEVLLANSASFKRVAHFRYFKLLGGEVAHREIGRNALSLAFDTFSFEEILQFAHLFSQSPQELEALYCMHQKSLNSPLTSSVGRWFDAVAFLCGLRIQSYEGESGVLLQNLYSDAYENLYYGFEIQGDEIVLDFAEIFADHLNVSREEIASKFINTLCEIIIKIAQDYSQKIVLCGGVFCNNILSAKVLERLRKKGRDCYIGNQIPPNDNGLALGQLYHLIKRSEYAR